MKIETKLIKAAKVFLAKVDKDVFVLDEEYPWIVFEDTREDKTLVFAYVEAFHHGDEIPETPSRRTLEKFSAEWMADNPDLVDDFEPVRYDYMRFEIFDESRTLLKRITNCLVDPDWK